MDESTEKSALTIALSGGVCNPYSTLRKCSNTGQRSVVECATTVWKVFQHWPALSGGVCYYRLESVPTLASAQWWSVLLPFGKCSNTGQRSVVECATTVWKVFQHWPALSGGVCYYRLESVPTLASAQWWSVLLPFGKCSNTGQRSVVECATTVWKVFQHWPALSGGVCYYRLESVPTLASAQWWSVLLPFGKCSNTGQCSVVECATTVWKVFQHWPALSGGVCYYRLESVPTLASAQWWSVLLPFGKCSNTGQRSVVECATTVWKVFQHWPALSGGVCYYRLESVPTLASAQWWSVLLPFGKCSNTGQRSVVECATTVWKVFQHWPALSGGVCYYRLESVPTLASAQWWSVLLPFGKCSNTGQRSVVECATTVWKVFQHWPALSGGVCYYRLESVPTLASAQWWSVKCSNTGQRSVVECKVFQHWPALSGGV
ncbi:hypothetical protein ACOMHN_024235 [Nucella lapillus]